MRDTLGQILQDLLTDHAALGRLRVFRENTRRVLEALKRGEIDHVDLTAWSFADSFFAFLVGICDFLPWAASSFPTPRRRHLVPVWMELCCAIHMALAEEPAFSGLAHLLQAGPILTRVKFNIGGCAGGFNYRNTYPRKTAVCPDTVRKYFRSTDPDALLEWFHGPVLAWFRRKRAFAKSRIFALDSTYIVVPDNPNYQNTGRMPLDDHNQPMATEGLSEEEKRRLPWKTCYKLTYLVHLGEEPSASGEPKRYSIVPAFRLGPGQEDSRKHGREIVETVLRGQKRGWMRWLIVDRGFLDGEWIGELKRKHGTNLVVALRKDMDVYKDVVGLARLKEPELQWETVREVRDPSGAVTLREQATAFSEIRSWSQCPVPLYVALMHKSWITEEGEQKEDYWALTSPEPFPTAGALRDFYGLRSWIEELNRQFKQPRRLDRFTSPEWSLVLSHVLFTLLTYSLIEFYLKSRDRWELTGSFLRTLQREVSLGMHAVVLYAGDYFGTMEQEEYTKTLLQLRRSARKRMLEGIESREREREGWASTDEGQAGSAPAT